MEGVFVLFLGCKTNSDEKNPDTDQACLFPFTWNNTEYTKCTDVDYDEGFWCGTQEEITKTEGWGVCKITCPKESGNVNGCYYICAAV